MNKEEIRIELIKLYHRIDRKPEDVIMVCKKYEAYLYEETQDEVKLDSAIAEKKAIKKDKMDKSIFT